MEPISFEELMLRHYNTLLRLSVQHTGIRAEAEDIVQDTFLKLLESGKTFRDDRQAKVFLIRAVINRCNDYYRSARRTRTVALSDTAVYADGYDWELRKSYYLASSFSMDGLCAVRINGAEISLT